MPVGDINSTEKGSAARYNDGKPPLHLIPIRHWYYALTDLDSWIHSVLYHLMKFQETGWETELHEAVMHMPPEAWEEAARVFEYGAEKYAMWNWCKGQQWTVALGSMLRHCLAISGGELLDPESHLPHSGHVACNLLMLFWFSEEYKEGREGFFINTELKG